MSWPVASTILGILATVCVAFVRIVPRRRPRVQAIDMVSVREFAALKARCDTGFGVIQESLAEIKDELKQLRERSR